MSLVIIMNCKNKLLAKRRARLFVFTKNLFKDIYFFTKITIIKGYWINNVSYKQSCDEEVYFTCNKIHMRDVQVLALRISRKRILKNSIKAV